MKALIKVGYACNENCTFCHTADLRHIDGDSDEVMRKIERAKSLGHTMVVLSGGEPTIRPELFAWAHRVAAAGLDLGLVTNGLIFAYPGVVERLQRSRLRYVYMSMHGGTAEIHNRLVRAETFEAAAAAVANLAGRGLDVTLNCVVTRQNLEHLRAMVDVVLPFPDVRLKFSMVAPKGGGGHLFELLTPRVSQVGERVRDALTYALERSGSPRFRFGHDGLPLCLLRGFEDLFDDLRTHEFATMVEVGEEDFYPVDDVIKVQPPRCEGCALRGPCAGLYRGYLRAFGDDELHPVLDRPRSNAFNYVLEAVIARGEGRGAGSSTEPSAPPAPHGSDASAWACPILEDGVTPWDRGRHLFVRHGGRIARFRAGTRDFSDVELVDIKETTGQLYLDVSRKDAPDDFARDLRKLERSALCGPCPERARCTGLFEPSHENVFVRDDAKLRAHLRRLEGRILDVGAGESPYGDEFEASAREGRARYVALEPDHARLRALGARRPFAELVRGCGESLPFEDGAFDHALLLRSWNHLQDPERALSSLRRILRPGGTLIVVDNVAFGLARTRTQTERAESSSAAFEHYRNDDAARAHRRIAAEGFHLLERWDVSPETSNQWVLRYEARPHGQP